MSKYSQSVVENPPRTAQKDTNGMPLGDDLRTLFQLKTSEDKRRMERVAFMLNRTTGRVKILANSESCELSMNGARQEWRRLVNEGWIRCR